ncbi:MAG: hypothetical protein RL616_531 [Verrucomicrobiota bacterium]
MKCGLKIWLGSGVLRGAATALVFCVCAAMADAQAASFQDFFTNRETIFSTNGTLAGNNSTATVEVGEPKHGGKVGGHSLWISWVAPTNGVATFDTHGSSFDTLMSAYTLSPTNGTTVNQLHEEVRNDDDPAAAPTSIIQIGAIAGRSYEIAVDGYQGATGSVVLNWSFLPAASPPPIIVSTPNDRAAKQGDPVNLAVNMAAAGGAQFQWYFNDVEDTNQSGTNYFIASLQPTNVGRYQLRVTVGNGNNRVRFFTTPVEIQINSDGSTNTLAEDKLFDALLFPLIGDDGSGTNGGNAILIGSKVVIRPGGLGGGTLTTKIGVVRGYNGSQIFNTTFATSDPSEPPHCGVTGGASYWLQYQPPTNGTMTLDTIGSSYDTVMEVYTYNGTLTSYTNLISIACDNDSVASQGAARVTFQCVKTRQYIIAVDGVNAARGTAWLNYALNTNQPATAPLTSSLVVTQTVFTGSTVTIAPAITGAQPMNYSWKKNGTNLAGATIPFLQLANVTAANAATYTLKVTNDLGTITISNILHVVTPMDCVASKIGTNINLAFPTAANLRYTIQQATNVAGPWTQWSAPFFGDGQNFSTNITGSGACFFRVRID